MTDPFHPAPAHGLDDVVEFTRERVGWHTQPSGGQVPVYDKVTPYWRWYCACGVIGARRPSEDAARSDHTRHADEFKQPSITCPVCGMTSYHPEDIRHGYCGNCHDYTGRRA